MKVKDLVKMLKMCNQNFNIELSRLIVYKDGKEFYDILLDFPLAGIADNGKDHIRIMLQDDLTKKENKKAFKRLGCKIRKMK